MQIDFSNRGCEFRAFRWSYASGEKTLLNGMFLRSLQLGEKCVFDGCRLTDSGCHSEALEPDKCVSDHFIYAHVLELHIFDFIETGSRRTHPSLDLAEALLRESQ